MKIIYRSKLSFLLGCIYVFFGACTKLVEVSGPFTNINTDNVYANDVTATAVLNSVYASFSRAGLIAGNTLNSFMPFFSGMSADELTLYSDFRTDFTAYYKNSLTDMVAPNIWQYTYPTIFTVNSAIEGINNSESLSSNVSSQLLGEAKFMRAFCYFYLVNLYGDVPLVLTTDYTVNSVISRTDKNKVIDQIISDLNEAEKLLSENYMDVNVSSTTTERTVPIKWAAKALLARVYLYSNKWSDAEAKATEVIGNSTLYKLTTLDEVFLKNNNESIWQLQPVNVGWNTEDAKFFIIPTTGLNPSNPVYLSSQLLETFEFGDLRRKKWVDSLIISGNTYYYPYKYKVNTLNASLSEYQVVLRLAEQYLIRAEAKAHQGKFSESIDDLNVIRNRAGLPNYNPDILQSSNILNAIMQERRVELFTEWGHRWLDLKRTSIVDDVMKTATIVKGGIWELTDQYYPINQYELRYNHNLIQNKGY